MSAYLQVLEDRSKAKQRSLQSFAVPFIEPCDVPDAVLSFFQRDRWMTVLYGVWFNPSTTCIPHCHVRQHIHKSQVLGHRHPLQWASHCGPQRLSASTLLPVRTFRVPWEPVASCSLAVCHRVTAPRALYSDWGNGPWPTPSVSWECEVGLDLPMYGCGISQRGRAALTISPKSLGWSRVPVPGLFTRIAWEYLSKMLQTYRFIYFRQGWVNLCF